MYGSKKKSVKKIKTREDVKALAENFLETQKKLMHELEKKYISDENKEKFEEKKKEFRVLAKKYIAQGEDLLKQIEAKEKLQEGKNKVFSFFRSLKENSQSSDENISENTTNTEK